MKNQNWSKALGVVGFVLAGVATVINGYSGMLQNNDAKESMKKEISKEIKRQLSKK